MVKEITQLSDIPQKGKVVIDFFATWCGPCKRITPIFEEFAGKFSGITFLKVDVDAAEEIAESYGVESLPTFVFLHNGTPLRRIEGANMNSLLDACVALEKL